MSVAVGAGAPGSTNTGFELAEFAPLQYWVHEPVSKTGSLPESSEARLRWT